MKKDVVEAPRALFPRTVRLTINTTSEVAHVVRSVASRYGWSLSKAGHMALVEGLRLLEEEGEQGEE